MYKYKCWLCEKSETVSDEWQVRKINIPIYVKKYMETKTEVRELCSDCYHKLKYNQECSTYYFVKLQQIKKRIITKLKELFKEKEE